MPSTMKHMALCAAAVVVSVTVCQAQEFDKSKHGWLKFKVGSWVKFKLSLDVAGQKLEGDVKEELAKVDDTGSTTKVSAKLGEDEFPSEESESLPTRDGEETLKIDGKEHKCVIWKSKGKRDEKETEVRVWMAEGAASPLRITSKVEGEDFDFTAVKLADEVSAAGKKLSCVKMDGKMVMQGTELKGSLWMNPDVPSGMVKLTAEAEGTMKLSLELVEFDAKK